MTEITWRHFITSICAYFEKKLAKETGEIWQADLLKIPDESVTYIYQTLKQKESFPRNFPAAVWAIYRDWLKKFPKRYAQEEQCEECDGRGWISAKSISGGNWRAFRCARCNPDPLTVHFELPWYSGEARIASVTKDQLRQAGYVIYGEHLDWQLGRMRRLRSKKTNNISDMAHREPGDEDF